MFNMFNISKLLRTILHANYYATVMWHFTAKSHWRPYLEVSCLEEVFCRPSTVPVCGPVFVTL